LAMSFLSLLSADDPQKLINIMEVEEDE
jgi:hypothetical protein